MYIRVLDTNSKQKTIKIKEYLAMNKLVENIEKAQNYTVTDNGAVTHESTLSSCVDYFALGGALRARTDEDVISIFTKAFAENAIVALKTLFYFRDVRGGQGERKTPRTILKYLATTQPDVVRKNLTNIVEFGRWDDLFVLEGTPVWGNVLALISSQLKEDFKNESEGKSVSLLAKWLPSINTSSRSTVAFAKRLCKEFELTPKRYRKGLSSLRKAIDVVERKMASNNWSDIVYENVPGRATMKYRNAFRKNDESRYTQYLSDVENGKKEIKSGTVVYPYDLIKSLSDLGGSWNHGKFVHDKTIQLQWDNLPNYVDEKHGRGIVVADVSGSMMGDPINVCLSLAIYFAERNVGEFKNKFITFSDNPKLQSLKGSNLAEKCNNLCKAEWGMSTNISSVFNLILKTAVDNNVPESDMPAFITIVSDMQFNQCTENPSITQFNSIKLKYEKAGYKLPDLIFWNVNAFKTNVPVSIHETGTALVSGCSPQLFERVAAGSSLNPYSMMMDTINVERYNSVVI